MNDPEDYAPDWGAPADKEVPHGTYFWKIKLWEVKLPPNMQIEKPYMTVFYHVTEGPFLNFKNSFRIYLNQKAKNWALWFLRKFNYPPELCETDKPLIRRQALLGLQGKIQVDVGENQHGEPAYEVKGFERLEEQELEDRLIPREEVVIGDDPTPSIDINADVDLEDLLG